MTDRVIVAAVLCALVAVALAIWLIPRWQVRRWRHVGIANEEKLAELGVQARSSITQALGGLALIVTLAITAFQANQTRRTAVKTQESVDENFRLAERGQASEQFSSAVEQLGLKDGNGDPAIDVRTGALFSLMRLGIDSETYTQPALLVTAAYVRSNFVARSGPHGCKANFDRQRQDVVTALRFVLYRIAETLDKRDLFGLRGAELDGLAVDGLILNRFNLTGVKFRDAYLVRAHFRNATLPRADFSRACLIDADFRGASVQGAKFAGANLTGAKFTPEQLGRLRLSNAQKRQVAPP